MPTEILKFKLKTYFKSKSFLCLIAVLIVLSAIIIGTVYVDGDGGGRFIYGVEPYDNFEELQNRIERTEKFILKTEEWLKAAEGDLSIPESVFEAYRSSVFWEKRNLNVMRALKNGSIEAVKAGQYPSITNMQPTKSNPASVLGLMLTVGFTVICIYFAVRTALIYPSESKGGQIKLTFLTPYGRISYFLSRIFSELVLAAIVLFGFAIFSAILCACFFGVEGYLIIATATYALTANFGISLIMISGIYLFTLCALCAFSAALSIFIKRRILTFAVVSVLAFLGKTLVPLTELFGGKIGVGNYIPPLCLFADNVFSSGTSSVWLCIAIGGLSSIVIFTISLVILRRRDI